MMVDDDTNNDAVAKAHIPGREQRMVSTLGWKAQVLARALSAVAVAVSKVPWSPEIELWWVEGERKQHMCGVCKMQEEDKKVFIENINSTRDSTARKAVRVVDELFGISGYFHHPLEKPTQLFEFGISNTNTQPDWSVY